MTEAQQLDFMLSQPLLADRFGDTRPTAQQVIAELDQFGEVVVHRSQGPGRAAAAWAVLTCGASRDGRTFMGRGPSAEAALLDCLLMTLDSIQTDTDHGLASIAAYLGEHSA